MLIDWYGFFLKIQRKEIAELKEKQSMMNGNFSNYSVSETNHSITSSMFSECNTIFIGPNGDSSASLQIAITSTKAACLFR